VELLAVLVVEVAYHVLVEVVLDRDQVFGVDPVAFHVLEVVHLGLVDLACAEEVVA